jgi:hypothetical protein
MIPKPMRSRNAVKKTKRVTRWRAFSRLTGATFDKEFDTLPHGGELACGRIGSRHRYLRRGRGTRLAQDSVDGAACRVGDTFVYLVPKTYATIMPSGDVMEGPGIDGDDRGCARPSGRDDAASRHG